jgi:hypothetical protein
MVKNAPIFKFFPGGGLFIKNPGPLDKVKKGTKKIFIPLFQQPI